MEFNDCKVGDTIRWDGVVFSGSSNMKAFHAIPKEWRRKMRAKVKSVTPDFLGSKLVELEFPERVVIYEDGKPKSLWTLGIFVREWTQEELEYINKYEDFMSICL